MNERSSSRRGHGGSIDGAERPVASGVVAAIERPRTLIEPGAILDGKYRIDRVLGMGAVGIVFEAQNLELDEKVAIKSLLPEMVGDHETVARFANEAKSAASIKSEYVATVHDVGTTIDGTPYIVMEYLDGKDLETILTESTLVDPRLAVEYTLQVCEALAVAHAKDIVHRDLKPANLLVTERAGGFRIVKVVDFGISKAALTGSIFGAAVPVLKTDKLMGTPMYMSPEQVRCSDEVDARSDIWSLGVVLYEILSGRSPFEGASLPELCTAILEAPPIPLESVRNDLPPGLAGVVERCLEKDLSQRYQTVGDLALALMPFGPKRARLNVERALAVLQSAGKLDRSVQVESAAPISSMNAIAIGSARIPPMPRAPDFSSSPDAKAAPRSSRASSAPTLSPLPSVRPETPVAPRRGLPAAALAVAALLVALGGYLVYRATSAGTRGDSGAASAEPSGAGAGATNAGTRSEGTSARSEPPSSFSAAPAGVSVHTLAPAAPATARAPAPAATARAPRQPATRSTTAAPRKAKPTASPSKEEPDLGY